MATMTIAEIQQKYLGDQDFTELTKFRPQKAKRLGLGPGTKAGKAAMATHKNRLDTRHNEVPKEVSFLNKLQMHLYRFPIKPGDSNLGDPGKRKDILSDYNRIVSDVQALRKKVSVALNTEENLKDPYGYGAQPGVYKR